MRLSNTKKPYRLPPSIFAPAGMGMVTCRACDALAAREGLPGRALVASVMGLRAHALGRRHREALRAAGMSAAEEAKPCDR